MSGNRSWSRGAERLAWAASVVVALLLAPSCSRTKPSGEASATAAASAAPQAPAIDARGRSTQEFLEEETYGDPALAKEPRLQFLWAARGEPRRSVWSMKLDGTDIRRVVGPEVIYTAGVKLLHEDAPVRSPDGRWLALVADDQGDRQIQCVVDLKEKKLQVLRVGGGRVHPVWTPDGSRLLFYSDLDLWQFEVKSGKLTKRPLIPSKGFYFIDGSRVVALHEDSIEYYTLEGKREKRVSLPFRTDYWVALSPDRKRLALNVDRKIAYLSLDDASSPVLTDVDFSPDAVFGPDSKRLYRARGILLDEVDLSDRTRKDVKWLPQDAADMVGISLVEPRSAP